MTNTFTPPTRKENFLAERPQWGLFRFNYQYDVGYSVLINSGVASVYPGIVTPSTDAIDAADADFIGGHSYEVTDAEKTILETASYTVVVT